MRAPLFSAALLLARLAMGQDVPAPVSAAATYVGSEVCQTCHEDTFNAILKSPHQAVNSDKKHGWDGKTCESCHGPGSKHAESASAADIRNPAKVPPPAADKTCLQCHLNQPTHSGRIQSSHAKSQASQARSRQRL